MSKNIRALSSRQIKDKTLFEALTEAGSETGSPSDGSLRNISDNRLVSQASLLGAVSFYDFLKPDNRGKCAYVCNGTSCLLKGKQKVVYDALLGRYSKDEIGEVACLGHCYRGEAFRSGEKDYDVAHCLAETEGVADEIPFYSAAPSSVFSDGPADIESYYQLALDDSSNVCNELSESRLRGRGGAGFLFINKLESCARTPGEQKYVVCNADEGDPGAFSDKYLLKQQPHAVLAGMLAAGLACGADTGFLYIRAEYPQAQKRITEAIDVFEQTSVYKQTKFHFRIVQGAGSYICGEETALLNSIEGLRAEVRTRPPYPAEEGLYGKPTLLSNVETFATIPWILQQGGSAFAAMGTEKSSGTKLVSLDHGFKHPGVHEVEMGAPLQKVIYEHGGGFHRDVKALQVGGPLGGIVPVDMIANLSLDFESFDQHGFLLGHAGIIAIPQTFPMIDFMRHIFQFMANESCGKCLPCRLGTKKGYEMLQQASKQSPLNSEAFDDLLQTLELGSLCGLGSGLPLPMCNIMTYFSEEIADYFDKDLVP